METSDNMELIGWIQAGIYFLTLLALCVYAWDTRRLRKTAELQQKDYRKQLGILEEQHELLVGQLKQSVAPLFTNFQIDRPESWRMEITFLNQGGRITSVQYRSDMEDVMFTAPTREVVDTGASIRVGLKSHNRTLQEIKEGRFYMDYTNSLGQSGTQEFYWKWEDGSAGLVK